MATNHGTRNSPTNAAPWVEDCPEWLRGEVVFSGSLPTTFTQISNTMKSHYRAYVYVLSDDEGRALYVGRSFSVNRPLRHAVKPWWKDAAHLEIAGIEATDKWLARTRSVAYEALVISELLPRENIATPSSRALEDARRHNG